MKTDEMKDHISITLVQPDMVWEDVELNLDMLDAMLEGTSGKYGPADSA